MPPDVFKKLIPYLLLLATCVFIFGETFKKCLQSGVKAGQEQPPKIIYLVIAQLSIAIYGGFFGAGAGILMLAALTLFGFKEMNTMNALKSFLGTCFNGIAVLLFIVAGLVAWPQAVLMSVGGSLGGYVLARFARKLPPQIIRWFVSIMAVGMTGSNLKRDTYLF